MNFPSMMLEGIWFCASILCVLGSVRSFGAGDLKTGSIFIVLAVISFLMFYMRRLNRKKQK